LAKKHQFPVWLRGTEAEQKAEAERQALAMASHSRAKMSEAERLVGRGQLLEQTARANLLLSKGRNKAARALAQQQLADALAMQGRFKEAATLHTDRHRRKHFRNLVKALEMPDGEKCKCGDRKAEMNGQEIAVTPRYEMEKIFSPIHNDIVSVVRCSRCGHRNARPLRSRLLQSQAAQVQNETAARSPNGARLTLNDITVSQQ
jgi:hypothetical protein